MNPILKLFRRLFRCIYYIIKYRDYRTYAILLCRYGSKARYKKCVINFSAHKFTVPDAASFLSTYKELFVKQIYTFQPQNRPLNILDFGSNVGLSILFFLQKYPRAHIAGYEADPYIYKFLQENIQNVDDENRVCIFNKAVWDKNTVLDFFSEGADGGRINLEEHKELQRIEVQSIEANAILDKYRYIDFLKIDIEGAEKIVLPNIKNQLKKVENIFVEYHSEEGQGQDLNIIFDILCEAGFRIYIQSVACPDKPFIEKKQFSGFDLQLNIFGVRT